MLVAVVYPSSFNPYAEPNILASVGKATERLYHIIVSLCHILFPRSRSGANFSSKAARAVKLDIYVIVQCTSVMPFLFLQYPLIDSQSKPCHMWPITNKHGAGFSRLTSWHILRLASECLLKLMGINFSISKKRNFRWNYKAGLFHGNLINIVIFRFTLHMGREVSLI